MQVCAKRCERIQRRGHHQIDHFCFVFLFSIFRSRPPAPRPSTTLSLFYHAFSSPLRVHVVHTHTKRARTSHGDLCTCVSEVCVLIILFCFLVFFYSSKIVFSFIFFLLSLLLYVKPYWIRCIVSSFFFCTQPTHRHVTLVY